LKKYTPLLTGLAFIAFTVAVLEWLALKKTGGHFCYPLDDPYIHMTLAKNLVLHGNWGINAQGWTSTSSSPLFTFLLALLFKVFSIRVWMPFLLSVAGAIIALAAINKELRTHSALSPVNRCMLVIITLLVGTVPAMTLLGMEHTLQIAFVLLFVHAAASVLADSDNSHLRWAALWAALMTFTRYETAFIVGGTFGLLASQRKFKAAFTIAMAGALPIVLFGLLSVSRGGYFIPNSVMIKGNQNLSYLLNGGITIVEKTGAFAGLFVVALLLAWQKIQAGTKDRDFWILCLFLFGCGMHAATVTLSWFYRYEAYLIVLGTLHIGKLLLYRLQQNGWSGLRRHAGMTLVAVVLLYSLPIRGLNSLRNSIRAIYNVYEQQYQMGQFLKTYYYNQTVAANDIGAISYYANLQTIDLWGLGNNEVMKARRHQYWNNDFLQQLTRQTHTRLAVMYDSWFDKDLSKPWFKCATWQLPYAYSVGDAKVSFYAMTEAEAATLKNNLKAFESNLPGDIKVEYYR
jgi:hypothetical protein